MTVSISIAEQLEGLNFEEVSEEQQQGQPDADVRAFLEEFRALDKPHVAYVDASPYSTYVNDGAGRVWFKLGHVYPGFAYRRFETSKYVRR